ncbi:hypothetical protein Bhyg_12170, partial [Pseudolycoriella hygida]
MSKQWKVSPPGPEQLALEAMFENDAIEEFETPASVQKSNPLLQPFTERVFSTHFRKTKAKFGACRSSSKDKEVETPPGLGPIGTVAVASSSRPKKIQMTSFELQPECDPIFKNTPHQVEFDYSALDDVSIDWINIARSHRLRFDWVLNIGCFHVQMNCLSSAYV